MIEKTETTEQPCQAPLNIHIQMDENDFEGTLVLERLARGDKLEEFFAAVDSQDFNIAKALMISANIDHETIAIVLKKMADPYDEH